MEGDFLTSAENLECCLFQPYTARQGVQTVLNINYIPDLLKFIVGHLNGDQLIRLEIYHLQTYLMEYAVILKQKKSLESITQQILSHIRSHNNFWYRRNNRDQINEQIIQQHHAVTQYKRDIQILRQAFQNKKVKNENKEKQIQQIGKVTNPNSVELQTQYKPQYIRKISCRYSFLKLHRRQQPKFGSRHPLNHFAVVPQFILKWLINHKLYEPKQNKIQQIVEIQKQQKQIQIQKVQQARQNHLFDQQQLKMLRECVYYFVCNKTQKKIDQLARQASDQESESQQNNSQSSQAKSIMECYIQYLKHCSKIPKFPNSHSLYNITANILQVGLQVIQIKRIESANEEYQKQQKSIKQLSFWQNLKHPQQQIINLFSELTARQLSELQVNLLAKWFYTLYLQQLRNFTRQMRKQELNTLTNIGYLISENEVEEIKNKFEQMLENPEFLQLTKYKTSGVQVPWKQDDYLKFLKGLLEYFNIPTNNKKISTFMGEKIQPSHVKYIKGIYLNSMRERMERGQCGGGKKGRSLSKLEFLEKDISNFSMRWFEKSKKIKKKRIKRKRKNLSEDDQQESIDSEY